MTLFYPFFLLTVCALLLLVGLLVPPKKFNRLVSYLWGRITCWMFGVTIRVEGKENIFKGPCVYLFNHTSFFDIFALINVIPGVFFGAKIELFRLPLFGTLIRQIGMLPISRGNREESIRVLREAEARFALGDQFALAPEGERKLEESLGPFKSGPFIFAIDAQVPVVPVIIRNAAAVLPKGKYFSNWGVWHREIVVTIEPAIATKSLTVEDRTHLQELVRVSMAKHLRSELR